MTEGERKAYREGYMLGVSYAVDALEKKLTAQLADMVTASIVAASEKADRVLGILSREQAASEGLEESAACPRD